MIMPRKHIYCVLFAGMFILAGFTLRLFAQQPPARKSAMQQVGAGAGGANATSKKDASLAFIAGNYNVALPGYIDLQKRKPKNTENNFRLGVCYLNTNVDKTKAISYLEYTYKQKDAPRETIYYLAKAYHLANRFDEAIDLYEKCKEISGLGKLLPKEDIDREIEMCENGKDMVKNPVSVKFENAGKLINSPYADYNPFISADESILVFSSRRKGNQGNVVDDAIGNYTCDIYISYMRDGKWTKAKSIGPAINTSYDESVVGISPDGQRVMIYMENEIADADIYMSTLKGKSWQKPLSLGPNVNSEEVESGACVSADGKTLYFSSFLKGRGIGGEDIYMSNLLPNGNWGVPINLGPTVNTAEDERAPYIHADGKTLYFSSKGHNSMGGFDIFKTEYDEKTRMWSDPENVGYPINTSDDNLYFSLSVQGKYSYVSAVRPEGMGDLDIYKVTFVDVPKNNYMTLIKGNIVTPDNSTNFNMTVQYTNKQTGEMIGQYTPVATTGKFIIASRPGTYTISVESSSYAPFSVDIVIPEDNQPQLISQPVNLVLPSK